MPSSLFPTTVIGSLPRPEWVREIILDRKAGRISHEDATAILDRAVESAILMQERAGLDEITDGEWRRESYVKIFAEKVSGFEPDLILYDDILPYPAVVAPLSYARPLVVDEVQYLRPRTTRKIKITLPSPYIIGCRMWHPEHSAKAYPKREQLMAACVPILRKEIEAVRDAGVSTVQLDEPWLCTMVDPDFDQDPYRKDLRYEMDLCADLINQTVDGINGLQIGMHLCRAHFAHKHGSKGAYDPIMPTLAKIHVDIISMEFATPDAGGHASLAKFPEQATLGLGCIDHCDREIESIDDVCKRVESAMRYVDKSRILLHSDCGFAPSVQNPIDLDEAYRKLKVMCEAAQVLREKHPG